MELNLRILQNETKFKDLERKIFSIVCKQAQKALKKLLEEIDQAIMKSRDKDKFKDIKKRTIDTLFGEVTIERRYYKDSNDEFRFLQKHYHSITHCMNSIAKFIDKYNNRKPHLSVGKIPPAV